MEKTKEKNMPEKKFRAGAVAATVWKNSGLKKNGEVSEFRTISLDRSYKDRNDQWQHTPSMRLNDLPKAVVALQKAYEFLVFKDQGSGAAIEEEMVM